MGPGVVDHRNVAHLRLDIQPAVDGELVIVFAQAAHNVEHRLLCDEVPGVVCGLGVPCREIWPLLVVAKDADVVVRVVHAWPHEVRHASVNADVVLVDPLPVHYAGDEETMRAGDVAPALGNDFHRSEPLGFDELRVDLADAVAHARHIHDRLLGPVRDADAAAEVDHLNPDAQLFVDLDGQAEQHPRRFQELVHLQATRDDHGVEAETLDAELLALFIALQQLRRRAPKLGFLRVTDDDVSSAAGAGVEAKADHLGKAIAPMQKVDVREIVEIDDRAELLGLLELLQWRVVAGEHDLFPCEPHLL
mmetsp:Transcript_95586/g.276077  ORF Transcript_95586/g.276077 Transcript_95586/m.276077 type:complete len:306 (+) Transcript_95586:285-1202(+)